MQLWRITLKPYQVVCVGPSEVECFAGVLLSIPGLDYKARAGPSHKVLDEASSTIVAGAVAWGCSRGCTTQSDIPVKFGTSTHM